MEAPAPTERTAGRRPACPPGLLGLVPLLADRGRDRVFAALGGPGLGERSGPPVEELAVERTVLRPGEIELTVRNDGPDPVEVAQVAVNDAYAPFTASGGARSAGSARRTLTIAYPWIEGEAYEISLLTSTGGDDRARDPGRRPRRPRPTPASSA